MLKIQSVDFFFPELSLSHKMSSQIFDGTGGLDSRGKWKE